MIVCVPVTPDELVDPRWGRADRVAVVEVVDGQIVQWRDVDVSWDELHDAGSSARHHARIARFLREHHVDTVVAHHVGDGMIRMMDTMGLTLHLEASGAARAAVLRAVAN